MSKDYFSIILVGAVWGCTNPFVRKGSEESEELRKKAVGGDDCDTTSITCDSNRNNSSSLLMTFLKNTCKALSQFHRCKVWIPYLLNQSGSILYYFLLATSDLTTAVPACNALALVFSSLTSYLLGERLNKPIQGTIGAFLVTLGVAICMISSSSTDENIISDNTFSTNKSIDNTEL